jgi:prophage tail gpP-like protein
MLDAVGSQVRRRLLEVRVAGNQYSGWKSAAVARSLDTLASTFDLSVTSQRGAFPLLPGVVVDIILPGTLPIGDRQIMRGRIDRVQASISSEAHSITISGRDRTADLIDCSIDPESPAELYDVRVDEIVRELARPFGITVEANFDTATSERFEKFAYMQGETPFAAIDRATRLRGLLAFTDRFGRLQIERPGGPGRTKTDLVEGVNIEAASWEWNDSGRFKTYIVRGQRQGSDVESGLLVAATEGRASDSAIDRFRPLVLLAEGPVTTTSATQRAQWEAAVRASRAVVATVQVPTWREDTDPNSFPWEVNRITRLTIPSLGLDADMLLNRVSYRMGEEGEVAELGYVRPNAYTVQADIPEEEGPLQELKAGEAELWIQERVENFEYFNPDTRFIRRPGEGE